MSDGRREEDRRMDRIEKQLTEQASWLRSISETLNTLAVQEEKIRALSVEVARLRDQHHKEVKTKMQSISEFQQTCPRSQLKWIWVFIAAPLWLTVFGAAWQLFMK